MEQYSQNTRNAIIAYEVMLREGKQKRMSNCYFQQTAEQNEETAIAIFKYAFEKVLEWSPLDVLNCLSPDVVNRYHLSIPYAKLRYPRELSKRTDYFYVAKICYPDKIHMFDPRELIVNKYKNMLTDKNAKFPKEYFIESEGADRAAACLQYVLTNRQIFRNREEMYEKFTDQSWGREFLKQYRLTTALNLVYGGCPLDYLHASLPDEYRDELLYRYGKFLQEYEGSEAKKMEPKEIRKVSAGKKK